MKTWKRQGFTIIELLIVLVIVGILAALTLISYNGIHQRATIASLSSDLTNTAKQLKLDQVELGVFPATIALAKNGTGLKASAKTTYQYSVNNSVAPQSFCVTATVGAVNYFINQDSTPQSGACVGHATSSIITNLIANPNVETSVGGWSVSNIANANGARAYIEGKWVYQSSRVTTAPASVRIASSTPPIVVLGGIYTASALVTSAVNQTVRIDVRAAGGTTIIYNTFYNLTAGIPQRISTSGIVNVTSVYLAVSFDPAGSVGDSMTVDEAMFTLGPTIYNYADGSSPGWGWSGSVNSSSSTGPAF